MHQKEQNYIITIILNTQINHNKKKKKQKIHSYAIMYK